MVIPQTAVAGRGKTPPKITQSAGEGRNKNLKNQGGKKEGKMRKRFWGRFDSCTDGVAVIYEPDKEYRDFFPDEVPELRGLRDLEAMENYFPPETRVGDRMWGELDREEKLWALAEWAYGEGKIECAPCPDEAGNEIWPSDNPSAYISVAIGICRHCGGPIAWQGDHRRWSHIEGGPGWFFCPDCGRVWIDYKIRKECPSYGCRGTNIRVHHVAAPADVRHILVLAHPRPW